MKTIIKTIRFWFNVILLCNKNYKHYYFKEWNTGDCFTSCGRGYEIINNKTNKVVIRKGKYTSNLDSSHCYWSEINKIFIKNI